MDGVPLTSIFEKLQLTVTSAEIVLYKPEKLMPK